MDGRVRFLAGALTLACFVGCSHFQPVRPVGVDLPRELAKTSHTEYVIEPPDELLIDAVRLVPKPPYVIEPLDSLYIQSNASLPDDPIGGAYPVEPEGVVNLGPNYGSISVVDLTLAQAKEAIEKHLGGILRKPPKVTVSIAQSAGQQQIRGSHLVRQDGTIGLGTYGSVHVVGLTLNEAKATIENHLSQRLLKPVVSVDVAGYNSKVVYVVTDGGGSGETVVRLPVTGNETVLDAVSQIGGLSGVSSKQRIWVARPSPAGACQEQVLPVDWCGIVRGGRTDTNYQLMSGDRVYIMAEPLVTTDTWLARIIAPMERILGFTLLGNSTVRAVQGGQNGINNSGF